MIRKLKEWLVTIRIDETSKVKRKKER